RRPDLPSAAGAVLQRATATRAEARYADMPALLAAWHAAIQSHAATTGDLIGAPSASSPNRDVLATVTFGGETVMNPYKGLRPFGEADARDFHGRDAIAEQLTEAVQQQRLVAVVGASGSGKSSLLHAGVTPRLRARDLRVASIVPGDNPDGHL